MSLRTDVHSAFDEIAPSTFGLPERVVETVFIEPPRGLHADWWSARLRAPLSLVAVLLLLTMVVGVLVGGRIVNDWNAYQRTVPASREPSELPQLQARPMQLPLLKSRDSCPETHLNALPGGLFPSGTYGSGPFYIAGGTSMSDAWGTYWHLSVVTGDNHTGLVLLRGRDLLTGQPVIFVGNWAAGPVIGADTVSGKLAQQYVELVLDRRHPQNTTQGGTVTWGFTAGLATGASGCEAWQIDTTDYGTQVLVTRSLPG